MNKVRRVNIGKLGLLILTAVSAVVTYGLNWLVRDYTNQVLDSWLFKNSEDTVASLEIYQPGLLLVYAAFMCLPCIYLFAKGIEMDSITLKILAVYLYLLIVLVLHLLPNLLLLPKLLLTEVIIAVALYIVIGIIWG